MEAARSAGGFHHHASCMFIFKIRVIGKLDPRSCGPWIAIPAEPSEGDRLSERETFHTGIKISGFSMFFGMFRKTTANSESKKRLFGLKERSAVPTRDESNVDS